MNKNKEKTSKLETKYCYKLGKLQRKIYQSLRKIGWMMKDFGH